MKNGFIQIPLLVGLVMMAVALPLVALQTQKNQENRSAAAGKCPVCMDDYKCNSKTGKCEPPKTAGSGGIGNCKETKCTTTKLAGMCTDEVCKGNCTSYHGTKKTGDCKETPKVPTKVAATATPTVNYGGVNLYPTSAWASCTWYDNKMEPGSQKCFNSVFGSSDLVKCNTNGHPAVVTHFSLPGCQLPSPTPTIKSGIGQYCGYNNTMVCTYGTPPKCGSCPTNTTCKITDTGAECLSNATPTPIPTNLSGTKCCCSGDSGEKCSRANSCYGNTEVAMSVCTTVFPTSTPAPLTCSWWGNTMKAGTNQCFNGPFGSDMVSCSFAGKVSNTSYNYPNCKIPDATMTEASCPKTPDTFTTVAACGVYSYKLGTFMKKGVLMNCCTNKNPNATPTSVPTARPTLAKQCYCSTNLSSGVDCDMYISGMNPVGFEKSDKCNTPPTSIPTKIPTAVPTKPMATMTSVPKNAYCLALYHDICTYGCDPTVYGGRCRLAPTAMPTSVVAGNPNPTALPTVKSGGGNGGANPTATVSMCTACPSGASKSKGDADCDGLTNLTDYSLWKADFNVGDAGTKISKIWQADFSGPNGVCDGKVDTYDYSTWYKYNYELKGNN